MSISDQIEDFEIFQGFWLKFSGVEWGIKGVGGGRGGIGVVYEGQKRVEEIVEGVERVGGTGGKFEFSDLCT